jgi:polar amino acid transport system permease protein
MSEIVHNFFNVSVAHQAVPFLMRGISTTLEVSACSIVLASGLGLVTTLARRAAPPSLRWILVAYVDFLRGIPPAVLVVFVYFALPTFGINLSTFSATVASLTLYGGAYAAEIFRGAFESVPQGQQDAARALGLTPRQVMWHVTLPQSLRTALPPLANEAIGLVKSTSVGFVIGLPELLGQATEADALMANATPLFVAAVVYILLLIMLSRLTQLIEARLSRGFVQPRL